MAEKLSCSNCKFKWTTSTGKVPRRCPYCGKDDTVQDLDNSVAKFMDVDDILK